MSPNVFSGAGYGCGQQIVEAISAVFPFDKIKIDRSFVKEFVERTDCVAILRAICGLGRSRQGRACLHVEQLLLFGWLGRNAPKHGFGLIGRGSRMGHRCLMLDVAKLRRPVALLLII
jgi:hypothetical protein